MEPWLHESMVLALIGASGVGVGTLLGWRHPVLLAAMAVLVSTSIRVLTALVTWSWGMFPLLIEAWWGASIVAALAGAIVAIWRRHSTYLRALGIFAGLGALSIAVKYLFQVGERHHRDSTGVMESALLIFQNELDPQVWTPTEKRGLAYPLMLALGPDSRMLSSITPLILFSLLLLAWWLAREIMRNRVPARWQIASGALVVILSLTVPIFRVALTYINSHTLVALGLLAMMAASITSHRDRVFSAPAAAMVAIGSLVTVTARVEGIVFALVILAAIVSRPIFAGVTSRVAAATVTAFTGLPLAWWLIIIGSDIADRFGLTLWWLVLFTLAGASLVAIPLVDKVRWIFFPLAASVIAVGIAVVIANASSPFILFNSQFNNVVRGYGGWGVAALALAASIVLLGWKSRSVEYRQLLKLLVTLIFATLFAKLFDGEGFGGGFGRDSFYDSVNRMWLHTLGIAITAMIVGYAEFINEMTQKRRGRNNVTSAPLHFKNSHQR